jgi:hypothetical protein
MDIGVPAFAVPGVMATSEFPLTDVEFDPMLAIIFCE